MPSPQQSSPTPQHGSQPHGHGADRAAGSPDSVERIAASTDYAVDAFHFVEEALRGVADRANVSHVNGRQLCEGLRELALERWGLMALAVLHVWGVRRTQDFGRIIFAMVDGGRCKKLPTDSLDDFRDVYDFRAAFGSGHALHLPARIG